MKTVYIYTICVSKNATTLASCSVDKHGLILTLLGKQHQHTNKVHIQLSVSTSILLTFFCF